MPVMKSSQNRENSRILHLLYPRLTIETDDCIFFRKIPGITFPTFELLIIQGYSLFQEMEAK